MADDTLTFAMGGRVEIGQFQEGITRFQRLVAALTPRAGVKWVIEDLQPGSAVVTLRAETNAPAKVKKIVEAYGGIGKALESREPLHYNKRVKQAAESIKILADSLEYVRFETPLCDYTISKTGTAPVHRTFSVSIGAISGRVQTLSNRGSLRFNLYDTVLDKSISCYLQPGQEELMREAWGRRVRVSGQVSRETTSGLPKAIRQILGIEILEEVAPGSYRLAKGAVPRQLGEEMPEDIIRRLRDG